MTPLKGLGSPVRVRGPVKSKMVEPKLSLLSWGKKYTGFRVYQSARGCIKLSDKQPQSMRYGTVGWQGGSTVNPQAASATTRARTIWWWEIGITQGSQASAPTFWLDDVLWPYPQRVRR